MNRRHRKVERSTLEFRLETLEKRILCFANAALTVLVVLTAVTLDGSGKFRMPVKDPDIRVELDG